MPFNRQTVPLVPELTKTVEAELHLESLFPEPKDYYPPPEGVKPLFSVSFEEIDLNGIERAYKRAKDEVLPLRNFLVGKKKGLSKNKSVLSFYCVINEDNEAIYGLTVDSIFIDKLQLVLLSPQLSVKMTVNGLGRVHVVHLKGISFLLNAMTKFKLGTGSLPITKQALENATRFAVEENRRISFQLTVDIECLGALKIRAAPAMDPRKYFCKLFDLPDSSKDVTIVASNKAEVKAHKNILMAQSPAFLSMFGTDTGMAEAKSGNISMEQNSAEGIAMFVRCLYGFDVPIETISPDLALEVFQLSHKYDVKELELGMKNFLTKKDVDWYTVDSLLELYFYVKNIPILEDLAEHALIELAKLAKQSLMSSDYFKKLEREDERDLLLELWDWK